MASRSGSSAQLSHTASFADVGALAYYLLAVPWQVPTFDITDDRQRLARLHTSMETTGRPLEVTAHRFWLAATKPAPTRPPSANGPRR